ncbi:MAG: hypothetical protein IJV00_06390 [Clostridia bacterium]|nr:hypothetical protein [Clostridia bacterium]
MSLWIAYSLPRAKKTVEALLEKKCADEQSALTLKELGLPPSARLSLRRYSSLRRVVDAAGESSGASGAAGEKSEPRYFIREDNIQRAQDMFCKKRGGIAQTLVMLGIFTAALVLVWMAASLIFDTESLSLPFMN